VLKLNVAQANSDKRIRVAQDPHPPSAAVQKAVKRLAKAADRETAAIKVKRPAA
jgi:hypothetical protein